MKLVNKIKRLIIEQKKIAPGNRLFFWFSSNEYVYY